MTVSNSPSYDVCIIGAGVAGAAMAAYLGNHGKKVVVVEKSLAEMDRILGELLQPGGVQMLKKLGLESTLENIDAQPVLGYGMFLDGNNFQIGYQAKEEGLTGYGFRNGKFVQNLRSYLRQIPTVTIIEGTVTSLVETEGTITGVEYVNAQEETQQIQAKLTIVTDGALSVFRSKLSSTPKKITGYFLGLVLEHCNLPYPNHGHVIMSGNSPVLLYPITTTGTRALIDFKGEQAPRMGDELKQHLLQVIGPHIPASAQPSFMDAVNAGKYKVFPNHRLPATPILKKGAVLLGDSLNMRHPLTGGGMTAAFSDCYNLGNCLLEIKDWWNSSEIELAVKKFYDTKTNLTGSINILADALYGVMTSQDLKQACYDYLQQGGLQASEPVSILSALSRDKDMLQRHFFAVAFHGAKNIMKSKTGKHKFKRSYHMLADAVKIISPLLLAERPSTAMKCLLKSGKIMFR
jgi:squalene monooxygenase